MRFRTKKELLEHLGKNSSDNKLVDRLIAKGTVEKISWGYELKDQENEEVEKLKKKVVELERQLKEREQGTMPSSSEVDEYKVNCEYRHKQYRIMKRWYELVIEYTYPYASKGQKIEKSEYNEQLSLAVREQLEHEFWKLE